MSRESDYISAARQLATQLWNAIHALKAMQDEWNALDYGNTLPDGTGINEGYTAIEVGAVVFETADAMKAVLDSGHATNVAKLLTWLIICGSVINHLDTLAHVAKLL